MEPITFTSRAKAHPADACRVIDARPEHEDGHSGWEWFFTSDGDLLLGCFPRGETYYEVEQAAQRAVHDGSRWDLTAVSRRPSGGPFRVEQITAKNVEVVLRSESQTLVRAPNGEERTFHHSDWDLNLIRVEET